MAAEAYTGSHVSAQVAAAWADLQRQALQDGLAGQDHAFFAAMREVEGVRDFVGSPEHILGTPGTKHGEIAEALHVGMQNARDALHGLPESAALHPNRISPTDYFIEHGLKVQSKYYNGLNNTLGGVLEHSGKYPHFSDQGLYHIPKDQYAALLELKQTGRVEGLTLRSIRALEDKIAAFEAHTGGDIRTHIKAGEGSYPEVTNGRIRETLDNREAGLSHENDRLKAHIREEHGPSMAAAGQAAAIGGGIGAALGFAQAIWVKHRAGVNMFSADATAQDWCEVGLSSAKSGALGAVSGGAVYAITASSKLAAPLAGAIVSGSMGVASVGRRYAAGEIDLGQATELCLVAGSDAALVGLGTVAGQTLIPVPFLGAVIGSLAGKLACMALHGEGSERALIEALERYQDDLSGRLDAKWRAFLADMDAYYGTAERLMDFAFDSERNLKLRLEASAELAAHLGVEEQDVLRSTEELDSFMLALEAGYWAGIFVKPKTTEIETPLETQTSKTPARGPRRH